MIIAAVAEANDCVLVTDNERDFIGAEDRESLAGWEVRTGWKEGIRG